MKAAIALTALCFLTACRYNHQPETIAQNYSLLPGQSLTLRNVDFRRVRVRSTFPVRVIVGPCQSTYTVDWNCEGDPRDVFVTDARPRPLFTTPRANPVTITASEF